MSRLVFLLLSCCLISLTACSNRIGSDEVEKNHPAVRAARVMVQQQDVVGAEGVLLGALREEPELALAHVELGMIYQSQEDSVAAIYHFQAYLALRPEGERAQILSRVIEDERRRLATQVGVQGSPVTPSSASTVELEEQLADAEQRIAELEVELQQAQLRGRDVSADPPPGWASERLTLLEEIQTLRQQTPSQTGEEPRPPVSGRTYTVQSGDNLSRIAQQVYGSSAEWKKIYEANRNVIPNKNVLSPGVELILP